MNDLEEKLMEDILGEEDINLERSLLIVSGLNSEKQIEQYMQKISRIHNGFVTHLKWKSPAILSISTQYTVYDRARHLFQYLWNTKPRRCNGNFLLTDVIDAQLDPDTYRPVGSCIGLTSLYTVLGLREDLNLVILSNGSHILNRLKTQGNYCDIENTDPLGFDCDGSDRFFEEYDIICLVAHVFNSRGIMSERKNDLGKAAGDYKKAVIVNPYYANALNNRGNVRFKRRDYAGALKDYDRAICLKPEFAEAYCNRGITMEKLGNRTAAIRDVKKALEIDPEYDDAVHCLGILDKDQR